MRGERMKKNLKMMALVIIVVVLSVVGGFKLFDDYKLKEEQKKQDERVRQTIKEVESLKIHSFLGLDFFTLKNEEQQERQEPRTNEMSDMVPDFIRTDDGQVEGMYFYYDGMYRLTNLDLRSEDYHVFNIKVTDEITSVAKIMKEYQYEETTPSDSYEGTSTKKYEKHDVGITFIVNEEETKIASIFIHVYNEEEHEGICYW
jgi:hypothetical protein